MADFQLGVIEGFYGRDWCDEDRLELLPWLHARQFQSYIYAPKSDASLRSRWQQPFPPSSLQRIEAIATTARPLGLAWGVGLSPLGAVHCFDQAARKLLAAKLQSLLSFQPDILAILFDDMHCSHHDLAERQCEIVEFIQSRTPGLEIIVCPSYYSLDPVLEKVFGPMPESYWETLGQQLPLEADIFWTGNKVCSVSIHSDDLKMITQLLKRPPTLWDNYPVNDGERASQFLHVAPFSQRDTQLQSTSRGHYCNPMNQCYLSRLALESLPALYQQADTYSVDQAFENACNANLPAEMAAELMSDRALFTELGLAKLDRNVRSSLKEKYVNYKHPASVEICEWLDGEYRFDPACLTEDSQ